MMGACSTNTLPNFVLHSSTLFLFQHLRHICFVDLGTKLIFVENIPDKVVEGAHVDFICRDSDKDLSDPSWAGVTIDWTYRNESGDFPIARNGSLVNNITTDRFVLFPDLGLTILKVRVFDSGWYRCEIKENSQQVILTAEALLRVHLCKYFVWNTTCTICCFSKRPKCTENMLNTDFS